MPKIFEDSGFIFRFYTADLDEPIHVHVEKDTHAAKFWVNPISCAVSGGLGRREINRIERIIATRQQEIIAKWNEIKERRQNAGRSR